MIRLLQRSTGSCRSGVLASAFLLLWAACAFAQTQNGDILGTVRDASGAVVPSAKVTAEDQLTHIKRTAETGPDGFYRFAVVAKGEYTITVNASGFREYVNRNVTLATNQVLRVDVRLEVGQANQQVTVNAQSAVINADSASISSTRGLQLMNRDPVNGGNSNAVEAASASISASGGDQDYFSFYGSRIQQATTTQDGIQYNFWNNYIYGYAAQEIKTDALLAPAKYQTPVTVNVVTRQGTNDFHGKIEGTISNGFFNAQPSRSHAEKCTVTRPCQGPWYAGFAVSGPVILPKIYNGRDKSFWMFQFRDMKNYANQTPTTVLVPSPADQAGNLSDLGLSPLNNPFTGQPFAGNTIPSNMISPVAQKLMALYPKRDTPGSPVASTTYNTPNNVYRTYAARGDQKITNTNQATFSMSKYSQVYASDFGDRSVPGYMGLAAGQWVSNVYTFGDTQIFSPTIVNEARFGWNKEGPSGYTVENAKGIDQRIADLGLTGIAKPKLSLPVSGPNIQFAGNVQGGQGFTPFLGWGSNANDDRSHQFDDNLSIQRGRHTIQTGIEFKWIAKDDGYAGPESYAAYTFDGRFSGNPFGDFLLGLPGTIDRTDPQGTMSPRRKSFGAFVQDDWRITPRLTLNLGVRWDAFSPEYEAHNTMYNFDWKTGAIVVPDQNALSQVDPAWPVGKIPIETASQAGLPNHFYRWDTNNFYPRIGFAYRPFGDDKTAIRGGYGIYAVNDYGLATALVQTGGPFALSTTFNNAIVNGTPLLQWPVGYPAAGGSYHGTPSLTAVDPHWVTPYTQQWNLTIERQLWGQGLRVSYIGTKDTKLGYKRNANLPPASTIPFTPARYLYPNFQNIIEVTNGGNADYEGLEANLRVHGKFGIHGDFGFGWQKQMSDVAVGSFESVAGNGIQNPYCRACDWGRSYFVPKFKSYFLFSWDVPVGKGKHFASGIPGWANQIVGGWMITSAIKMRSGLPFTPTYSGVDPSNTNTFSGRPDVVGNPVLSASERTFDRWYNPAAFAVPAKNAGRYGNAGAGALDGPGFFAVGLGLYKEFPINERAKVVMNANTNNLTNTPSYSLGRPPNFSTPPINAPNAGFMSWGAGDVGMSNPANYRTISLSLGMEF